MADMIQIHHRSTQQCQSNKWRCHILSSVVFVMCQTCLLNHNRVKNWSVHTFYSWLWFTNLL